MSVPASIPGLGRTVERSLTVVDSHTAGQPTRVITEGLPVSAGSAADLRELLRGEHDWVRRLASLEPRGHRSMMSVALIEPAHGGGRWGLVFMDAHGYPAMCGHATIGAATTLVRLGLAEPAPAERGGELQIGFDTPAGPIDALVRLEGGAPGSVALQAPLAFLHESVVIPTGTGETTVQVAYGGQWYAFIEAAACGAAVEPDQVDALIGLSSQIRESLRERLGKPDPRSGKVPEVGNVAWWGPGAAGADARNMPVSAAGAFDRSPCGTATLARLAVLHAAGALATGTVFVNEGVLGTRYRGRVLREVCEDGVSGVAAEVAGTAYLTGCARLVSEPGDPLAGGFAIGGGPAIGAEGGDER